MFPIEIDSSLFELLVRLTTLSQLACSESNNGTMVPNIIWFLFEFAFFGINSLNSIKLKVLILNR